MVALEIKLKLKKGENTRIKKNFAEKFVPAIKKQPGFFNAILLEQFTDKSDYLIILMFDTEEQRRAWVNSEEHDPAWGMIAELCESRAAKGYDIVGKAR